MNLLSSICAYTPRQNYAFCIEILHFPDREDFASGAESFVFVYGDKKPRRYAKKCIISHQTVSIWRTCGGGQGWILKTASYEQCVRYLGYSANSEVISSLKILGAFDLAEKILDFQSCAFPDFRS